MTRTINFLVLLFFLGLVSCDRSDNKDGDKTNTITTTQSKTDPCTLLSETDIRGHFQIGNDMEMKVEKDAIPFPVCFYEWGTNVYQGTVTAGGKTMSYDAPGEVSIVIAAGVQETDFEKSIAAYQDAVDMPGIGQKAVWGNGLSQLTFYKNNALVHIRVKVSADPGVNQEHAVELSDIVLKRM